MAQDPLLGYVLAGKYRIIRFVAEESLGRVYQAQLERTGQALTVKVLHPHLVDNAEVFGRWGREMMATAAVEHANTVQMIDFGEHRVFHYIVLEYLTARTLEVELQQHGRLPAARVAHISAQIAAALSAAHAEAIVHRNLAPSNILLLNNAEGDYIKVRDFGMSKLQAPDMDEGALTAMGTRVGTTAYMSPEYIDQALVEPRGDVYGLGCLMYQMLLGEPPFVGSAGMVMEMHIDRPPAAPADMAPGEVPAYLNDLILSMLQKDPAHRPHAADVVHLLEAGAGGSLAPPRLLDTTAAQPAAVQTERTAAVATPKSGKGLAIAGLGGIALVIVGLVVVLALLAVAAFFMM